MESVGCNGECAATFEPCGGKRVGFEFLACCSEDDECLQKNEFYSRCQPKGRVDPSRTEFAARLECGAPPVNPTMCLPAFRLPAESNNCAHVPHSNSALL